MPSIKNCFASSVIFSLACFFVSCNSTVEKSKSVTKVKTTIQPTRTDSLDGYFADDLQTVLVVDNIAEVLKKTKPARKHLFISTPNGETISVKNFIEQTFRQRDSSYNKGLINLDNDNIPELLIGYYTGGNHCCDGLWIGKKINDSLFEGTMEIEGGWVTINDQMIFRYEQTERLGYFYECYSCCGDYKSPYDYRATDIQFKYKNGYPVFISDEKNRKQIIKNLAVLSKMPVPQLNKNRTESDCVAYRKNFAQNIVALYFNDQQDSSGCKKVFYDFYKGTDRDTLWNDVADYFDSPFTISTEKTLENFKKLNGEK